MHLYIRVNYSLLAFAGTLFVGTLISENLSLNSPKAGMPHGWFAKSVLRGHERFRQLREEEVVVLNIFKFSINLA